MPVLIDLARLFIWFTVVSMTLLFLTYLPPGRGMNRFALRVQIMVVAIALLTVIELGFGRLIG